MARGQGFLAWFHPPTHLQVRYSSKLSQPRLDRIQQLHMQVTSALRSRVVMALAMLAVLFGLLLLVDGSDERRQQYEEKYGSTVTRTAGAEE